MERWLKNIHGRRIPNDKHDSNHHHSNHLFDNSHDLLDWEENKMINERDCEHCAHYKPSENGIMGCESWECDFSPKEDDDGD